MKDLSLETTTTASLTTYEIKLVGKHLLNPVKICVDWKSFRNLVDLYRKKLRDAQG